MRTSLIHVGRMLAIVGFTFGALWVASQLFGKTIPVYAYDRDLGLWVIKQDSLVKQRLEGSATSHYGPHGLNKMLWYECAGSCSNIFLWGDSFVEALNVADEAKPDAVLTKHLRRFGGQTNLVAWGIGESGLSCAGQIAKLQKYEKVLGRPMIHILFTTNAENDFGPTVSDSRAKLVGEPDFQIVAQADAVFHSGGKIRELLNILRINFVRDIINTSKSLQMNRLVFFKWPQNRISPNAASHDKMDNRKRLQASSDFLLKRLRSLTEAPILIVYCPRVPHVHNGIVDCVDPDAEDAVVLKEAARRNGIAFLDMTPTLVEAYMREGILCMGFQNGQLGHGHLNERGIEKVFSAVAQYLKEKYVIHAN